MTAPNRKEPTRLVDWQQQARENLLQFRREAIAWPYREGGELAAEPTALALLAFSASAATTPLDDAEKQALRRGALWLTTLQNPDGSVGVSAVLPSPGWPTPLALLAWSAVGQYPERQQRGVDWLLKTRGTTFPLNPNDPVQHDTRLAGWNWVPETHSWIEPTAQAILALRRTGHGRHPRVQEGLALLRDRALPSGGWNYGNKMVFGSYLRPQLAPTGLVLTALAGLEARTEPVEKSLAFVMDQLPQVRAAPSLAWGLLGLTAWNARPREADRWLAEAYARCRGRRDRACQLAWLLLAAAGSQALGLFHEPAVKGAAS